MKDNIFLAEFRKLNPAQRQAVETIEGPVIVVAGPGTGKTHTMAMRIANILRLTQVNPQNILCLTFTNSGVRAMRQHLLKIAGPAAYQIQIFTFHAFCNEVIQRWPDKFLSSDELHQIDELEEITVIQEILNKHNFNILKPLKSPYYYTRAILKRLRELKQENISPEKFKIILQDEARKLNDEKLSPGARLARRNSLEKNVELQKIYQFYQEELARRGQYDYSDMILFVLKAFEQDPELLSFYQEQFHYLLVDEYQDTNAAQNEIVKVLASFHPRPNLFVVGDDEQSIFRFQGAAMENILNFQHDFPEARMIVLADNYRSGQKILDASRAVIANNQAQIFNLLKVKKNLKSRANIQSHFKAGNFERSRDENHFIAQEIKKILKTKKIPPEEIAVLYREHRDAQDLARLLTQMKIPFSVAADINILDDAELQKLVTIFRFLVAPESRTANFLLFEIMHYPFWRISPLDIYRLVTSYRADENQDLLLTLADNFKTLKLTRPAPLKKFLNVMLRARGTIRNFTLTESAERILKETGYLDYLLSQKDGVVHLRRLEIFFKYLQRLNLKQKQLTLEDFLTHLDLLEKNNLIIKDDSAENHGIRLLTAHQAKGLEFKIVFLLRLVDKHWGNKSGRELIKLPSNLLKIEVPKELTDEEERRLFYVALTRAKHTVYLTYAENYSETEEASLLPSKFLSEIPARYVEPVKIPKNAKLLPPASSFATALPATKNISNFINEILADFKLNATAFNNYLLCPRRFFYDNILRVPKAKDFNQCYGTAVHFALERFFREFKSTGKLPEKTVLFRWFEAGLEKEILTSLDLKRALGKGRVILKNYYEARCAEWRRRGAPLALEYNFQAHEVHFSKIPLTGRLDKIELMDSVSGQVRIIDYKTSSPKSLNYILGLTKEKKTDLLYQAYFYKLLAETDPLFQWEVGEIAFEFLSERGFKEVTVPCEAVKFSDFKKLVQEKYQEILEQKFAPSAQCPDDNCDYRRLCQQPEI